MHIIDLETNINTKGFIKSRYILSACFDNGKGVNIKYRPYLPLEVDDDIKKNLINYYKFYFLNKVINNKTIIDVNIYPYKKHNLIMFDMKCNSCNRVSRVTPFEYCGCKCKKIRFKDWNIVKNLNKYQDFDEFEKNEKFIPNERYFIFDSTKEINSTNIFKGTYSDYFSHPRRHNIEISDNVCLNCGMKVEKKKQCPICNEIMYNDGIAKEIVSKRMYEKEDIDNSWESNIIPYQCSYYYNYNDFKYVDTVVELNLKYYYLEKNKLKRMGLYNIKYIDSNCVISDYLFYTKDYGLLKFENIYEEFGTSRFEPNIRYYVNNLIINPELQLLDSENMIKFKLIYFSKDKTNNYFNLNVFENNTLIMKIKNIKKCLENAPNKYLLLEFNDNKKSFFDVDSYKLINTNYGGSDEWDEEEYDFKDLNANITYNFSTNYLDKNIEYLLSSYTKTDNLKTKLIYINKSVYTNNQVLFKYLKENFHLELLDNEFENDKTENYIAKVDRKNKEAISFIEYIITKSDDYKTKNTFNYLIYGVPLKYITMLILSRLDIKEKICQLINDDIILISNKKKKEKIIKNIYMIYFTENDVFKKICNQLIKKYNTDEIGLIIILLYKYGEELTFDLPSIENDNYFYISKMTNKKRFEQNKKRFDEIRSNLDINEIKWKSEFLMFELIKSYFPDAIFQYKFKQLGQQSIDVFIPSVRIGFEYQGLQHYKAINFFGGNDQFQKQIKNDILKKKICEENNIILIEWNYTEKINKLVLDDKLINYKEKVEGRYKFND